MFEAWLLFKAQLLLVLSSETPGLCLKPGLYSRPGLYSSICSILLASYYNILHLLNAISMKRCFLESTIMHAVLKLNVLRSLCNVEYNHNDFDIEL